MARFFVNAEDIQENQVYITGEDVKHITKVLRLNPEDQIMVCTGDGLEHQVKLTAVEKEQVIGQILQSQPGAGEPSLEVILIQGLPKGEKMEYIIQKCTELGISEIWPVSTERTIVQLDAKKARQRQQRWQRVAMEAGKQAGRAKVPVIQELKAWADLKNCLTPGDRIIMPWENERAQGLKQVLVKGEKPQRLYILIGPEGGFADQEVEQAIAFGAEVVTLGSRILRTETAGMATLAMVLYHFGDLG